MKNHPFHIQYKDVRDLTFADFKAKLESVNKKPLKMLTYMS